MANKIDPFNPVVNNGLYDVHFPDFAFWLQKTQPLVYDDALSYYDVLCRISAMLNQLIKQVNDLTDAQKKFIEDATNLLNQIIREWNGIVTEWNGMKTTWTQWSSTWAQWTATWAQWTSTFAHWTETFNNMVQNNNQFQSDITKQFNSYKEEINNFVNEVNEKIKDFVTVGILEHVATYGGMWEQVVHLDAGASTRLTLPENMHKPGLFFLANASIDCEGVVVNVDNFTVVAYNASSQAHNPNLQVYALGEFGLFSH